MFDIILYWSLVLSILKPTFSFKVPVFYTLILLILPHQCCWILVSLFVLHCYVANIILYCNLPSSVLGAALILVPKIWYSFNKEKCYISWDFKFLKFYTIPVCFNNILWNIIYSLRYGNILWCSIKLIFNATI